MDNEFIFQILLEPSEIKKWTVREMLHKTIEDQHITFAQVCTCCLHKRCITDCILKIVHGLVTGSRTSDHSATSLWEGMQGV